MLFALENTFGVCLSRLHLAHSDLEVIFIPGNDSMHVMHVGELRAVMSLWKACIFAWTRRCSSFGSCSSFIALFCILSWAEDILVALSTGVSAAIRCCCKSDICCNRDALSSSVSVLNAEFVLADFYCNLASLSFSDSIDILI